MKKKNLQKRLNVTSATRLYFSNIFSLLYCFTYSTTKCIEPMSLPHTMNIALLFHLGSNNHHKGCDGKKKIWFVKQRFQAEIHFMNLLKLDLDYAVWIWFAEILLHLEIFITLLFSPAAKAFKISPCRYPESSLAVSDKWRDWRQEKNVDNLWLWKKVSGKNAIM